MQNLKGGLGWSNSTIYKYTNITNVRNVVSETTGCILIIWQDDKWRKKTIKNKSRNEELQKQKRYEHRGLARDKKIMVLAYKYKVKTGTAKEKNEKMDKKLRGIWAQNMKNKRKRKRKRFKKIMVVATKYRTKTGTAKEKNKKMATKMRGL